MASSETNSATDPTSTGDVSIARSNFDDNARIWSFINPDGEVGEVYLFNRERSLWYSKLDEVPLIHGESMLLHSLYGPSERPDLYEDTPSDFNDEACVSENRDSGDKSETESGGFTSATETDEGLFQRKRSNMTDVLDIPKCFKCHAVRKDVFTLCQTCFKEKRKNAPTRPRRKLRHHQGEESVSGSQQSKIPEEFACKLCFDRKKDAVFIHGKVAHNYACMKCSKKEWRRTGECPICREKVERVVRICDL